jgi:hypothetical protein
MAPCDWLAASDVRLSFSLKKSSTTSQRSPVNSFPAARPHRASKVRMGVPLQVRSSHNRPTASETRIAPARGRDTSPPLAHGNLRRRGDRRTGLHCALGLGPLPFPFYPIQPANQPTTLPTSQSGMIPLLTYQVGRLRCRIYQIFSPRRPAPCRPPDTSAGARVSAVTQALPWLPRPY